MDIKEESLRLHQDAKGKIEVISRVDVNSKHALAVAYTPGVAEPCLQIQEDVEKSFELTRRWNLVAVITDGTAVLGLGDIGPEAGMPVMEGKCILFKTFGEVDAFPLCIKSKDVDEIVKTISLLQGSFGGINLEDISAPRCFEIEQKLKECCDIPVFHDDQHGTAIIVLAGIINALKLVNKSISDVKIAVNGPGAAGTAIINLLAEYGARKFSICDEFGMLYPNRPNTDAHKLALANRFNPQKKQGLLSEAIKDADIFIGVSKGNLLTEEMIKSMKADSIVFAMANPTPEIMPDKAKQYGAKVVGTGRSDFANQVNNVLAFPGVFRGALDVRAKEINVQMKIAAAEAIASLINKEELSPDKILPEPFDKRVCSAVANAVADAARKSGVSRK